MVLEIINKLAPGYLSDTFVERIASYDFRDAAHKLNAALFTVELFSGTVSSRKLQQLAP